MQQIPCYVHTYAHSHEMPYSRVAGPPLLALFGTAVLATGLASPEVWMCSAAPFWGGSIDALDLCGEILLHISMVSEQRRERVGLLLR